MGWADVAVGPHLDVFNLYRILRRIPYWFKLLTFKVKA